MRHFLRSWLKLATAALLLALGNTASTAQRLLMARVPALVAAVPLASVTVRADRHLTAATDTDRKPIILANRHSRLPRGWNAECALAPIRTFGSPRVAHASFVCLRLLLRGARLLRGCVKKTKGRGIWTCESRPDGHGTTGATAAITTLHGMGLKVRPTERQMWMGLTRRLYRERGFEDIGSAKQLGR